MLAPQTPGVYRTESYPPAPATLSTAVPAFLGLSADGDRESPRRLALSSDFGALFGAAPEAGLLGAAIEGFFANGGDSCFVVRLDERIDPVEALVRGLQAIVDLDDLDLVCIPDACRMRSPGEIPPPTPDAQRVSILQRATIDHCELVATRIAILDSLPSLGRGVDPNVQNAAVLEQRRALTSPNAALYHPWILVRPETGTETRLVPPCGHVAGIYARSDRTSGVHKAPANEVVLGALDLDRDVTGDLQASLNPAGVNCLRTFPGRGIRVWGARTLSTEPAWTYVNVRRLVLTVARAVGVIGAPLVFEPQGEALWRRVRRDVSAFLTRLYGQGALRGASASDAFYVRCDAQTNAGAEQGQLVAEIGLAAARPNEFIVVHVVNEAGGVSVAGPNQSN